MEKQRYGQVVDFRYFNLKSSSLIMANYNTASYKDHLLKRIFNHAIFVVKGMFFNVKINQLRNIVLDLFYVPSKDMFIIPVTTRVTADKQLIDVYGIEFIYEPKAKHMIQMNTNIFLINKSVSGILRKDDIFEGIQTEYKDVIHIVHERSR